jgi:hypothetical protein
MADYRLYAVGPDGHFVGVTELVAGDDEQAVRAAEHLRARQRQRMELWELGRLVAVLEKGRAS